jgi:23S rRNA (uracil1939-C5)-methyltransferase
MRKGDIIDLRIDRVAHGGQGVARAADGFVVFVKGGVPGDVVKATLTRKKKDFAEARVVELIQASPDRVAPPCPYFGHCGGCQWQHVRYTKQLEYKKGLVEEAFERIGGLSGIPIHDPIGSEKIYGYRNKMEFSFSNKPWVINYPSQSEGRSLMSDHLALGLHVPGTFHKVLDIEACLLQEDRGKEILRTVKHFARESGMPAYDLKSHKGFWRFLTIRHSSCFDKWMVNVITSEYKKEVMESLAGVLTSSFHDVVTVVNNITARKASIAVGEWETVVSGQGTIQDRIGPYCFQISSNSFFQANSQGAAKLYAKVAEFAELTGSESVLDLYSGTGTIPISLSDRCRRVVGMEISQSAVQDAWKNCRSNGIENCQFILGDIRTGLVSLSFKPDVLIIDPPRAGMHEEVVARVLDLAAEKVVYVSCNPSTMARDMALLKRAYEVVEIQPVDMFPQTYHIESVAGLVKIKTVQGSRRTADEKRKPNAINQVREP